MVSSTQHVVLAKSSAVSAMTQGPHFFNLKLQGYSKGEIEVY